MAFPQRADHHQVGHGNGTRDESDFHRSLPGTRRTRGHSRAIGCAASAGLGLLRGGLCRRARAGRSGHGRSGAALGADADCALLRRARIACVGTHGAPGARRGGGVVRRAREAARAAGTACSALRWVGVRRALSCPDQGRGRSSGARASRQCVRSALSCTSDGVSGESAQSGGACGGRGGAPRRVGGRRRNRSSLGPACGEAATAGARSLSSGSLRSGGGAWAAPQRRALELALRRGSIPSTCPACGGAIACHAIETPPDVAYVRRRVLLVCTACHRSGGFDAPPAG